MCALRIWRVALAMAIIQACGGSPHGDNSAATPAPVGQPRVVQEGAAEGAAWKVSVIPASHGGRCVSVGFSQPQDLNRLADAGPGCAPVPSITNPKSQPLYSLLVREQAVDTVRVVAGTVLTDASAVGVRFSDGSSTTVPTSGGVFITVFPAPKTVLALRPIGTRFPSLECHLLQNSSDGGCTGYTMHLSHG
jgi:hypothetical protein